MNEDRIIKLDSPEELPDISLPELLKRRRSHRDFTGSPLTQDELSIMLWAAFGYRERRGAGRTVPSAGAIYPVELHAILGRGCVEGLSAGVYSYLPQVHSIQSVKEGDLRDQLVKASLSQEFIGEAPVVIAISADLGKTTIYYGQRGIRYVHMDIGHIGQNIYLMAEALGLGTVAVGAFDDERVGSLIGLPKGIFPFYLMPVGRVRK